MVDCLGRIEKNVNKRVRVSLRQRQSPSPAARRGGTCGPRAKRKNCIKKKLLLVYARLVVPEGRKGYCGGEASFTMGGAGVNWGFVWRRLFGIKKPRIPQTGKGIFRREEGGVLLVALRAHETGRKGVALPSENKKQKKGNRKRVRGGTRRAQSGLGQVQEGTFQSCRREGVDSLTGIKRNSNNKSVSASEKRGGNKDCRTQSYRRRMVQNKRTSSQQAARSREIKIQKEEKRGRRG